MLSYIKDKYNDLKDQIMFSYPLSNNYGAEIRLNEEKNIYATSGLEDLFKTVTKNANDHKPTYISEFRVQNQTTLTEKIQIIFKMMLSCLWKKKPIRIRKTKVIKRQPYIC